MQSSEDYLDEISSIYPDIVYFPEYTPALLGIAHQFGSEPKLVYDYNGVLAIIMLDGDMLLEEAQDHFEFNVAGTYAGPTTPILMERRLLEEPAGSTLGFSSQSSST